MFSKLALNFQYKSLGSISWKIGICSGFDCTDDLSPMVLWSVTANVCGDFTRLALNFSDDVKPLEVANIATTITATENNAENVAIVFSTVADENLFCFITFPFP